MHANLTTYNGSRGIFDHAPVCSDRSGATENLGWSVRSIDCTSSTGFCNAASSQCSLSANGFIAILPTMRVSGKCDDDSDNGDHGSRALHMPEGSGSTWIEISWCDYNCLFPEAASAQLETNPAMCASTPTCGPRKMQRFNHCQQ